MKTPNMDNPQTLSDWAAVLRYSARKIERIENDIARVEAGVTVHRWQEEWVLPDEKETIMQLATPSLWDLKELLIQWENINGTARDVLRERIAAARPVGV